MTLPFDPRLGTTMPFPRRRLAASSSYGTPEQGFAAIDENINNDLSYDASDALNRYAQGAWGSVQEGLKRTLADANGEAVGAGRFDSGYLDEDKGVIIRDTANNFSRNLAQQAMNAENLTQDVRGRGLDALWGRTEQVTNDAREAEARRRQKKRGIFGAIGSVLGGIGGAIVGGPAGAAIGGKIGGSIGGAF